MTDIMLDLETYGVNNNAPIVQIGAYYFDRHNAATVGEWFLMNVTPNFHLFTPDIAFNAIEWWMMQSDEARKSLMNNRVQLSYALHELNKFVSKRALIWSHSNFDFVILMNAYDKLGIKPKTHYRNSRDIRTLVDLAGTDTTDYPQVGVSHNALDDCKYQVQYVVAAMERINVKLA